MRTRFIVLTMAAAFAAATSCTVKPPEITVTGEKTVLERQLLGEYELSSQRIFLPAASGGIYAVPESIATGLRGEVSSTYSEVTSGRREYLIALANHKFNLDDVNRFKDLGVIGEDNQGLLRLFESKASQLSEPDRAVLRSVIDEENGGRLVIMRRVIQLRADLSEENLPEIQRIFAQRNFQEEKPGRMVQTETGEWVNKQ